MEADIKALPRPLRIAAFPPGGEHWRVDWFGPIAFPDRAMRRRMPSVLVSLSKVGPLTGFNPELLTRSPASVAQIKCWVSVGTVMLLRVGDVWSDQKLLLEPSHEELVFDDVEISPSKISLVKAGIRLEDESYLLPLLEHPWHRDNTQSYCVRVVLNDGRSLVIPCMELIRHYFGSSSELLSRLFLPPLSKERLFDRWHMNWQTRRMSIELADRMPGTSAEDVARIAASGYAWKAASLVGLSCLQASIAGRDAYPQMLFPFEGLTRLAVDGKWLSCGGKERQTFVVYKLRSCWHPFPFETLRYRTKGLTRRTVPMDTGEQTSSFQRKPKKPEQPVLCEQDAGSALSPTRLFLQTKSRFPYLDDKIVWRSRPVIGGPALTSQEDAIDQLAIGEPGSSSRVRAVTLEVATKRESELPPPEYIKDILGFLKALPGSQITLLTASSDDGWTVPLPLLADEDGVIDEALLIGTEELAMPRKVCAFLVAVQGLKGVLIVIEAHEIIPLWYLVPNGDRADPLACLHTAASDFSAQIHKQAESGCGDRDVIDRERLAMWFKERCGLAATKQVTPAGQLS